jgi:hypothetical protein
MAARFVTIDRDSDLLLPPNMRGWVPENLKITPIEA